MRVALGLRPHSGWTALVVVGEADGELEIVERRRLELVEPDEAAWAKQPYHAAEELETNQACALVDRAIASTHKLSQRELKAAITRIHKAGHEVAACAVLMGEPMPDWTTVEILSVHFRMHQAEGALFRDALARATEACGVTLVAIPEKRLDEHAQSTFGEPAQRLRTKLDAVGKAIGPPWGKDQKDAALAAWVGLRYHLD
jgi:hypothetical protein